MNDEHESAVGDLHADDLGRIARFVDPKDNRRQVAGKLIGIEHVVIGTDLHTSVTLEYRSHSGSISMTMPSYSKLLFGPPVTSRAELLS